VLLRDVFAAGCDARRGLAAEEGDHGVGHGRVREAPRRDGLAAAGDVDSLVAVSGDEALVVATAEVVWTGRAARGSGDAGGSRACRRRGTANADRSAPGLRALEARRDDR
jgi:hypothetical protein